MPPPRPRQPSGHLPFGVPRDVCYYDGACGVCRRSTRVLGTLDWLGRLEFRDMLSEPDLPVSMDDAMRGMPMRTDDGEILLGFPAVRRALRRTPLGFLPAMLLHLPGVSAAGRIGYDWFAARRGRQACRLHGER